MRDFGQSSITALPEKFGMKRRRVDPGATWRKVVLTVEPWGKAGGKSILCTIWKLGGEADHKAFLSRS